MKHILYIVSTGMIVALILFVGMVNIVHAETRITEGFLGEDTIWTAEESPYVLTDVVTVPEGVTLTIGPGVEIRIDEESEYQPYIYVSGELRIEGTESEPIKIGDIWGLVIDQAVAHISHAQVSMRSALTLIGSIGTISSSTISNTAGEDSVDGIYIKNSDVKIRFSRIENNRHGIFVQGKPPIFQASIPFLPESGGLGNALDEAPIVITNTALIDNHGDAVHNLTEDVVDARHNWWGTVDGPESANTADFDLAPNAVTGPVEYDPWLDQDPLLVPESKQCCSSVLFIPGLEGSRLYRDEPQGTGIGRSTTTNRLWEPNRNDDVRKLFLTTSGSSTDRSIYVGEPIDMALGFVDVYESFMTYLDNLVRDGTISTWKSFGYDWRMPITEVVAGSTVRATTTESLIENIETLAAGSKTGKVSLVAHSNGGLVARYLIKILEDIGKTDLIDRVISVAVPQVGTPQALLALLHGYNQALGHGIIAKASVMRELGRNMSSAYSLLPSREYFTEAWGPTIAFASTSIAGLNSGGYPTSINSYEEQRSFLLDSLNSRLAPSSADLASPIEGNATLVAAADILHGLINPVSWPSTILHWAVVGWGNRTPKALRYSEKKSCGLFGAICTKKPIFEPVMTEAGDGTVIAESAAYSADAVALVDLEERSQEEDTDITHTNIMESSATQEIIGSIISEKEVSDAYIPGVTIPDAGFDYGSLGEDDFLVVSTHSPVELHVYDTEGNHTGIISAPTGVDEDIEPGLYTFYETKIPGSSFEMYGEGSDADTYISFPDVGDHSYSIAIEGTGVGEFTYRIERVREGQVVDRIEYTDIPVTPLTTASTSVRTASSESSTQPESTIAPRLASSTPPLRIDVDGNGTTDMTVQSGQVIDKRTQKEFLKKALAGFVASSIRPKGLIWRIRDRLERMPRADRERIGALIQALMARL